MRNPRMIVLAGALTLACVLSPTAEAEMLITVAEANLPQAQDAGLATRGITRGPGIEQVSPPTGTKTITSPLPLRIKFVGRNNVAVDPASVRLTYLKSPMVDLTERIKSHVTKDGIDMEAAEVPPGNHVLRLDVKDAEGRSATSTITLTVVAK
jgi:hypothetical protein